MNKNILFLLNEYPAKTSPTSLAAEAVIKEAKKKYNVFCLAINGDQTYEEGVYSLYNKHVGENAKGSRLEKQIFNRLRLLLFAPFYPNTHPIMMSKFEKKAVEICEKNNIDIVVSVVFPIETLGVGARLKKKYPNIKHVPYFIDGYACGKVPKYLPKQFAQKRKIKFELENVLNADVVIRMEASRQYYDESNINFNDNTVYLNPAFLHKPENGKKSSNEQSIFEKDYINILYTGYLCMPERNPSFIIDAFSGIDNVCLIFIGKNEAKSIIEKKKQGFKGIIKSFDFIPRDNLLTIMGDADCFLNLGASNSNAISGKIFDYISYGKPIISSYFMDDDATLKYLRKYELACCINQKRISVEDARIILEEFLISNRNRKIDFNDIEQTFYNSSPNAVLDIFGKLI